MIVIEKDKCTGCGLCAKVCHEESIIIDHGTANRVEAIDHLLCSTCIQCIAVCPWRALSWNQHPPQPFDNSRLPSMDQLDELLKQRRTVRHFKKKRIDRTLIESIIGCASDAPTNNYAMRAVAVDDPDLLLELDAVVMRFVKIFYNLFYRSGWVFNIFRRITPEINLKNRVKMQKGVERGHAYDSLYTTTVLIVGDGRILLSEASAQYALYNMILYAQTLGIGSRINGGIVFTLNRSGVVRKRLGIDRHERILGALDLGYPAVKFSNKVEGKTMPIDWREKKQLVGTEQPASTLSAPPSDGVWMARSQVILGELKNGIR